MTYTAVVTHATGDVFPASDWNTYVRDNLTYLHGGGGAVDVSAGGAAWTFANRVDLGQSAAGQTGNLRIFTPTTLAAAISLYKTTDAQPTLQVNNDGTINIGGGGAVAPDVTLYRSSAGNLRSNSSLTADGNIAAGLGTVYLGSALDTSVSRATASVVASSKVAEPFVNTNVTVPITWTPDVAAGLGQRVGVTAGGASTLTIGAVANQSSALGTIRSMLLVLRIVNTGGGTITLAWNAIYHASGVTALPASVANGAAANCLFYWNPSDNGWQLLVYT